MTSVNAVSPPSQTTMTPQDRVRRQVGLRLIPQIAALLYRADKGNERAELADLRSEGARAVYLADALRLLEPVHRAERIKRVQAQDAHVIALAEDESETVQRQARQDVAAHAGPRGTVSPFGRVKPGYCEHCQQAILGAPATLMLSEHLSQQVHLLCAMDAVRRGEATRLSTLSFVAVSENGGQQ